MKLRIASLLCALATMLGAQENVEQPSPPTQSSGMESIALRNPVQLEVVIKGNNTFGFEFYQQMKNQKGNLFFSPYNIINGFAMLGSGAKGDTMTEMAKVFHYIVSLAPLNGDLNEILSMTPTNNKAVNQLSIASNVWVQKGFSLTPFYQHSLKQNFKTTLEPVDFHQEPWNAVKAINQWVSSHTNGKISQLLNASDVTKDTRMVLTTAIYMKGSWQHPFDINQTKKEPFYITEKYTNQVDMMHTSARYGYMSDEQIAMIEMPYIFDREKGAALAMYVILPNAIDGMDKLEASLNIDNWSSWTKKLQMQKINLSLPRYREDERIELNKIMQALGLVQAFTPKADFSGITDDAKLYINKAIHKTYIKIDEKGTEAAAATAIVMVGTAIMNEKPIDMVVNHPFILIIADKKTESILFMGRVMQP